MKRNYYCKDCGNVEVGTDCDEMTCSKCGTCEWSPREVVEHNDEEGFPTEELNAYKTHANGRQTVLDGGVG